MPRRTASLSASSLIAPFYPALDGLRAVAFVLVFLVHYGVLVWPSKALGWGWVGVDVFFVLSGFLITGILYDTLQRKDFFRSFYIRRSLRIFPLFYTVWIVLLLLTPVLKISWNRYNLTQALYFGNFYNSTANSLAHTMPGELPFASLLHAGNTSILMVGHFWTLCVEEQFYLIWPAVIWLVRSRRTLIGICLAVCVLTPFLRLWYLHTFPGEGLLIYSGTFFRLDTLLMGSALALWLRGTATPLRTVRRGVPVVFVTSIALLTFFYLRESVHTAYSEMDHFVLIFGFTLIGLACCSVLVSVIDAESVLSRVLRNKPCRALGRLSYGAYVFHAIPLFLFQNKIPAFTSHHVAFLFPVSAFLVTMMAAKLSFHYLESPFLRLKDGLAPSSAHVSDPPPEDGNLLTHDPSSKPSCGAA